MAEIRLPEDGRPYVLITAEGEASPLDVDAAAIIDLYKRHGALLLRGFGTELDDFRRFAQQFCASSVFNESPDRQLLDSTNNIQSVNAGLDPFPLHPELSREPWKPDVCFFGCLSAPSEHGATTICDGVELVAQLPDAVRRGFADRRLIYVNRAGPEILQFWLGTPNPSDAQLARPGAACPYIFRRAGNAVVRAFTRPALHKPMFDDRPAFGNFLLFARYYLGRQDIPIFADGNPVPPEWVEAAQQVGQRLSVALAWQKGDVLMLDNTRFMHGRTAISDPSERLIASYFGYLNFALPNPEEPANPPWRRATFRPPQPRPSAPPQPR